MHEGHAAVDLALGQLRLLFTRMSADASDLARHPSQLIKASL